MEIPNILSTEEEYKDALKKYDELFHINDCCSIPDYGSKLYDLIKDYESKHI